MLVGFDCEYGFPRLQQLPNGRLRGDVTTLQPVCACLYFANGDEVRLTDKYDQLEDYFCDPQFTFLVHGAHAEFDFCRSVGIRFPVNFVDTLLMGVMTLHAAEFQLPGRVYIGAALTELMTRYHLPFFSAGDKDEVRKSILRLNHVAEFGMASVLDYCAADARAVVLLYPQLRADMIRLAGPNAERNLLELYQQYSLLMAAASRKGLRFDCQAWDRLESNAPKYRARLRCVLNSYGYAHDGVGIGDLAFGRLVQNLGLENEWPRTPSGKLSTREEDIKFAANRYAHPALSALRKQVAFDKFMVQDIGRLVDHDGRIRCSILPLAQRTGRNSTISPNLVGMPRELRPLLLPDEGCRFLHFDYTQQEPGIAGYLSGDKGLMTDFANGDFYVNLGLRMRLLTEQMPETEMRQVRNGVLKALMLAILYGKGARSISCDLGRSYSEAMVLLLNFQNAYSQLFTWLKSYVSMSLEQGFAVNIIGHRAAFNIRDCREQGHIARSCQNFPIQSSAAACFQLTGTYLGQFGSDIRLPLHDAYLTNVADDPQALEDERQRIVSATMHATEQLFPGLAVKREIEQLCCFAKDGKENSLENLLTTLEASK